MAQQPDFLFMVEEDIPCWYKLSWRAETLAILVMVHKEFTASAVVLSRERSPLVAALAKKFKFAKFNGDLKAGNLGFEDSLQRAGEQGDFIVFQVPVPVLLKETGKKCSRCKGTKKDDFGECLECCGRGVETEMDWQTAYSISASFTVFFGLASIPPERGKTTSCSQPQLMLVDTLTNNDMHGGSLDGMYGIPLVRVLREKNGQEVPEMSKAMAAVYCRMYGELRHITRHDFWARVENENGWLNVNCPGDACGLHPKDSFGMEEGRGYEFSCHNVDNPMQQLTLLAGLAALCDKARQELGFG